MIANNFTVQVGGLDFNDKVQSAGNLTNLKLLISCVRLKHKSIKVDVENN